MTGVQTCALPILLWESTSKFIGVKYFPNSITIIKDLPKLVFSLEFFKSYASTLVILIAGVSFGIIISVVIGLLLSSNEFFRLSLIGTIDFLRFMPAVALIPILIVVMGTGADMVVFLTTFVVASKLIVFVLRGFLELKLEYEDFSRVVSLGMWSKLRFIYLPCAISSIALGLRITVVIAFGTVVASGVAAGTLGIGSSLLLAEISGDQVRLFSYVLVMGWTGIFLSSVVSRFEKLFALKIETNFYRRQTELSSNQ